MENQIKQIITEFKNKLYEIESATNDELLRANEGLELCHRTLSELRRTIIDIKFSESASEVNFFKEVKVLPMSHLLFFEQVHCYETFMPRMGRKQQRKYLETKMEEINVFFSVNAIFVNYIRLERTDMDVYYFTRKSKPTYGYTNLHTISFDPKFNTDYDLLLANMMANVKFENFIQTKMDELGLINQMIAKKHMGLKWTGSKVALIELARSLALDGSINNGNISFRAIIKFFEDLFETDLGDYENTASRLRHRSQPTKFTDRLRQVLLNHFRNLNN